MFVLASKINLMYYQAMRVIITDKRYGALKSLGERKEAFNEVNSFILCLLRLANRSEILFKSLPFLFLVIVMFVSVCESKEETRV